MHKLLALAATTAAVAVLSTVTANAATFVGGFTPSVNSSDPGLVLHTQAIAPGLNFALAGVGSSTNIGLFKLYTDEGSVNADDEVAKAISVLFSFTLPGVQNGSVVGSTVGVDGFFEHGRVTWGVPALLNFGSVGQLRITLNDADFNTGFFDLNEGPKHGAVIKGNFKLLAAAVPEPATWAMMITGFGLIGATQRRRRSLAAA